MEIFKDLKAGIKGQKEIVVLQTHTAKAYGSGLVDVFATPAMIALMENAAHTSLQHLLPEGYITVGTEVNIKHIKATSLNKRVWAESVLLKVEGRKLQFDVAAYDEEGKIGFGTHTRYLVESKSFAG